MNGSQQWICTKCGRTITTSDKIKPRPNNSQCRESKNKLHSWKKNG